MAHTQAFRVAGTTDSENIIVHHVGGTNFIFWEDIVSVFPNAHLVKRGEEAISFMRDENLTRYEPLRIEHHPGIILDIVLSATSMTNTPNNGTILPVNPLSESIELAVTSEPFFGSSTDSKEPTLIIENTTHIQSVFHSVTTAVSQARQAGTPLSQEQIMMLTLAKLAPTSTIHHGFETTVNRKLDALHLQGAMTQRIALEVLRLQEEMKNRLMLIQSKTEAILTQQIELAEYPIPRLFIVLPEEPTKYDPANWFRTKFCLHFICECGEHTQAAGSNIPHHLHLAKHEGYVVREPTEIFKKYGPFLLLMLELIKSGTNIDGRVVPSLNSLMVDQLADSGRQTFATITAKIDYSLNCIDWQMGNNQEYEHMPLIQPSLADYLSKIEGLEGVELRQLGSFLKISSNDNLLGNLYRMTTPDGHVKWVCRDHYRTGYQEAHTQKLRDVVNLAGGIFDEQLGKVEIALQSSFAADEFYGALCKARGVLELVLDLRWDCTKKDIDALHQAVKRSLVSILHADLRRFQPSYLGFGSGYTGFGGLFLSISDGYTALHRLLQPVNLKSIHLVLPNNLLRLSNFTPKRPPHLHRLTFEIVIGSLGLADIRTLAEIHNTSSPRITLYLSESTGDKGDQALTEALKSSSTLTILDLSGIKIGEKEIQALSEALKTNSTLTTLDLRHSLFEESGAQALSEALKANSTLTTLDLSDSRIGDGEVHALSEALKINSTLTTLNLNFSMNGTKGMSALSQALMTNSTLTALDLDIRAMPLGKNAAELFEALKINSTLTTLRVKSSLIAEKEAQVLSEVLKTNSTLATLDLTSIGGKGAQALSAALKTNSTLTILNLRHCPIGENGVQALSEALVVNSTLTTLSLRYNRIGDNGAVVLSSALKTNHALVTLDLRHNIIGEDGAHALSEALKINSTLTSLNLRDNSIAYVGTLALSGALKINSTLTSLNLRNNSIAYMGVLALSEALEINSTLTILNLRNNSIEYMGALALSAVLQINSTLTALSLCANPIEDIGAQALSRALMTNSTLNTLRLNSTSIGKEGAQALSEALKTNLTLTTLDLRRNPIGEKEYQELFNAISRPTQLLLM